VYNTSDKILYKYGAALVAPLSKHLELSIRYDAFAKTNSYYTLSSEIKTETKTLNYITHLMLGGVKWRF
jgi:hypothetical protein